MVLCMCPELKVERSIIIANFSLQTGSAFVTQAQREWIDLQKLIKRLKPSKRPKIRPTFPVRAWCYDRAIHKHGWWSRMMTLLFLVQIVVLMSVLVAVHPSLVLTISCRTEAFSTEIADDWHCKQLVDARPRRIAEKCCLDVVSLFIATTYAVDTTTRLYGLGWHSFRANGWNLFDVVVASGSFTTMLVGHFCPENVWVQLLQKLFLVSIAFKLVQRMDSLNQLFKTGT